MLQRHLVMAVNAERFKKGLDILSHLLIFHPDQSINRNHMHRTTDHTIWIIRL